MNDAEGQTVTIRLAASPFGSETYEFGTSGTVITSPGFMSLYGRQSDESDDEERELPNLSEGDAVLATSLESKDHQTKPPARYTEATLVRQLEELGWDGRAPTRAFLAPSKVEAMSGRKAKRWSHALTAFATVGLMENHFPHLVDYALTAAWKTTSIRYQ